MFRSKIPHHSKNQEDLKQRKNINRFQCQDDRNENSDKDFKAAIMNASTSNKNMFETHEKQISSPKESIIKEKENTYKNQMDIFELKHTQLKYGPWMG